MSIAVAATPPAVLCFGAGDASGASALTSDLLTLASMGCHPLPVQTAVLLRDTRNVDEVWAMDAEVVVAQARAVLEDIPVAAFKLGFCGSVENAAMIAEILSDYPDIPLVLEPALYAGGDLGDAGDEIAAVLADLVLPQTYLLVAGRHELCSLAGVVEFDDDEEDDGGADDDDEYGDEADDTDDDEAAATEDERDAFASADVEEALAQVLGSGTQFVLLTGAGEQRAQVINSLIGADGLVRTDAWPRLPGRFLGAGATLAAAVAAGLAHGMALPEAVHAAQEFTFQALQQAYRPGMGLATPDRFFWARARAADEEG